MGNSARVGSKPQIKEICLSEQTPQILITLQKIINKNGYKSLMLTKNNRNNRKDFYIELDKEVDDVDQYVGMTQIFTEKDIKVFQGNVANLKREGFGIQYDEKGKIFYRGQYLNNVYHGWGVTAKYQGQYRNGKKNGWGIWNDPQNQIYYEGGFKQDKFNGYGYLNVKKDELDAFVTQYKVLPADSKTTFKYVGDWAEGQMHGKGKIITKEEVYQGYFTNNQYHGEGELIQLKTTQGRFYNGKKV